MIGFTADVLGKIIQRTLLSPWKTLPLLLLAHFTERGRDYAQEYPRALKTLKVLTSLAVLRRFNAWLNHRVLNNGVSDTYNWSRELVMLTGGSNGIGRQTALMLAKRGITVAVLDIRPPPETDETKNNKIHYFECDITSSAAVSSAATAIRSTLGTPTILINNAGICSGRTILGGTEAQTRLLFEVNTLSHYHLAREFVPALVAANHGMVVTISSQCGYTTTPNMVDYSATKAAALAFHEGLTAELTTRYRAPRVRTVLVAQGFTRTALIQDLTPEDTWFNPMLAPETVAENVVQMVLKGSSGRVVLPGSAGWFAVNLRGFPLWFQTNVRASLERLMRVSE